MQQNNSKVMKNHTHRRARAYHISPMLSIVFGKRNRWLADWCTGWMIARDPEKLPKPQAAQSPASRANLQLPRQMPLLLINRKPTRPSASILFASTTHSDYTSQTINTGRRLICKRKSISKGASNATRMATMTVLY